MSAVGRLRTQAGLTQQLLADRSGISQQTISRYETEKGSPTLRTLDRLAHSVGLRALVSFLAPDSCEQPKARPGAQVDDE
jgi:transcriptional regulator with XRE-family HTH domain